MAPCESPLLTCRYLSMRFETHGAVARSCGSKSFHTRNHQDRNSFRFQTHLEKFWPSFACDEQTILFLVISDAVENIRINAAILRGQQAAEVNHPKNSPVCWIDAHHVIGSPNVRKDL